MIRKTAPQYFLLQGALTQIAVVLVCVMMHLGCGDVTQGAVPNPPASFENDPTELLALKRIAALPVQNLSHPSGAPFSVTLRTNQMTQYPCQSCHTKPVPKPQRDDTSQRWSHLNIQLTHGQSVGLDCQSCHDYDNFNQLRLQNGKKISFDHSYQLCHQCHFQQAEDWAGGAHGKRLAGWRGKRIVKNCTDCHNPHAPGFDQRVPYQAPTVPRTGRTH